MLVQKMEVHNFQLPPFYRTIANRICDPNLDFDKTHDQA